MKIVTHGPEACRGRNCVIHNPSDHHMKGWPVVHRLDRAVELDGWDELGFEVPGPVFTLTERTCPCGVGHPDPDSLGYAELIGGEPFANTQGVHGCCGKWCCRAPQADPEPDDPEPPLGPWPPVPGEGEMVPDPECTVCRGSGIDPDYPGDDHGFGYGVDPGSLTPCECVIRQWGDTE